MENRPKGTSVLTVLTALHAISSTQATISMQLAELIEATNVQRSDNLVERLSELFQPLFEDMAEIRDLATRRPR